MKRILHILPALLLAVCLLAGSVFAALDQSAFSESIDLADTTRLYSGTQLISTTKGLSGAQENYVRYTKDRDVQPIIAYGKEIYGASTISQIAKKLSEDGLSIVAGINASFFETETGLPYGLLVTDGVLRSASTDMPSVGFYADGSAIIGSPELSINVRLSDGYQTSIFYNKRLNDSNGIGLYSRDYDSKTKNKVSAYNVLLEPVNGADAALPLNGSIELEVVKTASATASCTIPDGSFVLAISEASIYPTALDNVKALKSGDRVVVTTSCAPEWTRVQYACSGSELLVDRGIPCEEFTLDSEKKSAARTAVGIDQNGGLVLYTVDGGKSSSGMNLAELADRMAELGCVTALNLDGGGSTSLGAIYPGYASGTTVNQPEDGALRACANFIFLVRETTRSEDADMLCLYPYGAQAVLPGAKLNMTVKAADRNYMPAELPDEVAFGADGGEISAKGVLTVDDDASGYVTVSAVSGDLSARVQLPVLDTITELSLKKADSNVSFTEATVPGGSSTSLAAVASYYGRTVASQNSSFEWTVSGGIGAIDKNGVFKAADTAQRIEGTITVSYGDVTAEAKITVAPANPFADMSKHWAKDYVNELYFDGVLTGSTGSDGKLYYRPNDSMTRQEFVVALMRFLDVDVTLYTKSDLPYADNDKIAKWAQDAMKAAYQLGYMSGSSSNGKLYAKPTATISRQEAMVILARSQKLQQEDESVLDKFTDAGRVASWARPELAAMVERGIISGSKGKLNPTGNVTRGEVAKMLYALRYSDSDS